MKTFVAAKALILHEEKVLVVREATTYADGTQEGKYDLIGGRLEEGERLLEGLQRECKEEVGLDVLPKKVVHVNDVVIKEKDWHITRIFYLCEAISTDITLSEEHDKYKWIVPEKYKEEQIIENLYEVFDAYLNVN